MSSLRARLAGALLLASLPGVVLGALEARRAYVSSTQQADEDVNRAARQVAGRVEEVVTGAQILVESLSQSAPVRAGGAACNDMLTTAAAQSDRFGGISRADASGRVLCSSLPGARGMQSGDQAWFQQAIEARGPVISAARIGRVVQEQLISVTVPVLERDRATGIVTASLRGSWLITQAAADLRGTGMSVVLVDRDNEAFAVSAEGVDVEAVLNAAEEAARGAAPSDRTLRAGVREIDEGGLKVVAVAPEQSNAIGFRSALIVAAPLIALALAITAVWLALNWWVLRWIDKLGKSADALSTGRHERVDVSGAPDELKTLGHAFEDAMQKTDERANELSALLAHNLALTRELHHRVKNNLQVITSSLTRQFRRTTDPAGRYALAEARARLLPIALAYRYNAPGVDDLTRVDLSAYLTELTRQTHATLDGGSRGVEISVETEALSVAGDVATAIGTMVSECLTAIYLSSVGMSNTLIVVRLKAPAGADATVECRVERSNPSHEAAQLDRALIEHLANQIGGALKLDSGPRLVLTWTPDAAPH